MERAIRTACSSWLGTGSGALNRISIPSCEMFDGTIVCHDELAKLTVILPEHIHNFFGFRCFSEAREASQINVPVTSARRALRVFFPLRGHDDVANFGRKKPSELRHSPNLR